MTRALALAVLAVAAAAAVSAQPLVVLHVRVVATDAAGQPRPLARHALLVSDEPQTRETRRVVTGIDGTLDIRLRPGTYVIESDQPAAIDGRAWRWRQMLTIAGGSEPVLELTAGNAVIEALDPATADAEPSAPDTTAVLRRWLDSVVELWSPTAHASGFLVDATGFIATNQRVVGEATTVEVQLSRTLKVAGTVVAADAERDIAIVRIDPSVMASAAPVPIGCGSGPAPAVAPDDEIFVLAAPLRQQKGWTPGSVRSASATRITADLRLAAGGSGGPVFNVSGELLGLTALPDDREDTGRIVPIVRLDSMCELVAEAAAKAKDAPAPGAAPLPVEPLEPAPVAAFGEAGKRRAGSLMPYRIAASDFDVAFITPLLSYAAQSRPDESFGNWSDYVADIPPVLLVRVTPKMAEGFWARIARGAAYTQGVALPAMKRLKTGFERLQAFCDGRDVTPIHPFRIEARVSETEVVHEGLYAFDPAAFGPECASVTLALYSEKDPSKADIRAVDPAILEQIRRDFDVGRSK